MISIQDIPEYKTLDKIVIPQRDGLGKVIEWSFEDIPKIRKFPTSGYPLQKGIIQIEPPRAELLFIVSDKVITISLFYFGKIYLTFNWDTSSNPLDYNINILHIERPDEWNENSVTKYIREACMTVQGLMFYMANFREEVRSERVRQIVKKKKKGKKGSQQKVTYIGKHYISVPKVIPKTDNEEKRSYTRHTDSWTVRGFWRTYKKTGKRVWIEPDVRGPKRHERKPEGKTYKVR